MDILKPYYNQSHDHLDFLPLFCFLVFLVFCLFLILAVPGSSVAGGAYDITAVVLRHHPLCENACGFKELAEGTGYLWPSEP